MEQTKLLNRSDRQYEKMVNTPIPKLVISLGIPTTISMLVTSIYNMADSYFVSEIGVSAGGATSVVFGLMSIIQAFGFMFGHGSGSKISRLLGARKNDEATTYASTGFFISLFTGIIIALFGFALFEPMLRLFGSTDTILPYAKDYAKYILLAAPAMTASCVLNNILRYEGKAALAMIGLTSGGILNMLLDPLFIWGFDMGIAGAGLATALSQVVSFCILLSVFLAKRTQSRVSIRHFTLNLTVIGNIVMTGLPSLARQGLNSVSTMLLNAQAKVFGDVAIAAMGYVARTSQFVFCVGLGIGQGFQPVSAYNYGAKKYSRVRKSALFTLFFGAAFIGLIAGVCFAIAPRIIALFGNEPEVIKIGGFALRIYCASLLFVPISVVTNMLFQSIGKNIPALILSVLQNGLAFIPLITLLPRKLGLLGIQLSQPLAYVISAAVCLPCLIIFLKSLPEDE
ncbi:MAG: MATE family efflux transporter [Ruminococcaceae bacterium]|nr:MATE family efflux transporter [Oscillospiraceae bacterium]